MRLVAPDIQIPVTSIAIGSVIRIFMLDAHDEHIILILMFLLKGPINGSTETANIPRVVPIAIKLT